MLRFPVSCWPDPACAVSASAGWIRLAARPVRQRVLLDQPGHRLRRVRAVLPVPARRHAAVLPRAVHRRRRLSRSTCTGPPSRSSSRSCCSWWPAFLGNVVGYEIGRRDRAAALPTRRSDHQEASTSTRPTPSSTSTATRRWSSVGSCRSCAPTSPSSPGSTRMERRRFLRVERGRGGALGAEHHPARLFPRPASPWLGDNIDKAILAILAFSVDPDRLRVAQAPAPAHEAGAERRGPEPRRPRTPLRRDLSELAGRAGGVQVGLGEHRAHLEADIGQRVLARRAAVDRADDDLDDRARARAARASRRGRRRRW